MLPDLFWSSVSQKLYAILFDLYADMMEEGMIEADDTLKEELNDLRAYNQVTGAVDWALMNEHARDFAETYTYNRVKHITDSLQKELQSRISDWVARGGTLGELIADVSGVFSGRAELIAATEVTRAFAQGNLEYWGSLGDVVEDKLWQTAEDELVCEVCAPLNNTSIALSGNWDIADLLPANSSLDTDIPSPPAHPGCRCWIHPVIKKA